MSNKKLIWSVLAVSLAFNVFAGGIAVSHFMDGDKGHKPKQEWRVERFSMFSGMIRPEPEVREKIKAAIASNDAEMKTVEDALKSSRQQMRDALRAEPFDKERMQQAYTDLSNATNAYQMTAQNVALDVLAGLTPEQRKTLAEWPRHRKKQDKK